MIIKPSPLVNHWPAEAKALLCQLMECDPPRSMKEQLVLERLAYEHLQALPLPSEEQDLSHFSNEHLSAVLQAALDDLASRSDPCPPRAG